MKGSTVYFLNTMAEKYYETLDEIGAYKAPAGGAGSIKVSSPMPGKILAVKANVGDSVKKGQVILILEAMKMENEVVAPEDGTIASIDVTVGASVESGDTLATLN